MKTTNAMNRITKIILLTTLILILTYCKNKKNSLNNINNSIYTVFFLSGDTTIFVGGNDQWILNYNLMHIDSISMGQEFIGTIPCSNNNNIILNTCKNGSIFIKEYTDLNKYFSNFLIYRNELIEISNYENNLCKSPDILSYYLDNKNNIIKNPHKSIFRFAWYSYNTNILLAIDIDGYFYRIDIENNTILNEIKISQENLNCVHSNKENNLIVVSSKDSIYILNEKFEIMNKLFVDNGNIFVSFILEDQSIVCCTENGLIVKFKKDENKMYRKAIEQKTNSCIYAMNYNSNFTKIVTGGQDGWLKIWDANTLELLKEKNIYE